MHVLQRLTRTAAEAATAAQPTRRGFLRFTVIAGAGLTLAAALPGARLAKAARTGAEGATPYQPFVRISPDGLVTVINKHQDMGQGNSTGLATLVADEMDATREQMRTEFAPANVELYANSLFGIQGTGGSTAMPNSFEQYRRAGATARAMLVNAAAQAWGVPPEEITVSEGRIRHEASGNEAGFGDMAEAASTLAVPAEVTLKAPEDWIYIGKEFSRLDAEPKSHGSVGMFGMDVRMDNMLVAAIAKPTRFGAKVASFDAAEALKVPGVVDVIEVPQGVAVLAEKTWPAFKGLQALSVTWDDAEALSKSDGEILAEYRELAQTPGQEVRADGDAEAAIEGAAQVVEAEYAFPFLAHAPMEPLDVTVLLGDGGAEFWTGSQLQTVDQNTAAAVLGLEPAQVQIHTLWGGGSFGRRAIYDSHYIAEAASIAKAWRESGNDDRPIKLVYTRENDIQGGYYRPMYVHKVRIGLGEDGKPVGWHHRIVGQSILIGSPFEAFVENGIDDTSVEGVSDLTYDVPALRLELHTTSLPVPPLWWRAVGHTHTAYAVETIVDKAAKAAGQDPVAYRRDLLRNDPRKLGVLNKVAEISKWDEGAPEGRARGVAVHKSFGTYVAEVAEVSMEDGRVRVHEVWAAVDCGIAVNPDNIRGQIEGGVGYGLAAILHNGLTLNNGAVQEANFDTYTPLRIDEMPGVTVAIVESSEPPMGVGEPGTPPIGPAVANAIFALTGEMPTDLPLAKAGLV